MAGSELQLRPKKKNQRNGQEDLWSKLNFIALVKFYSSQDVRCLPRSMSNLSFEEGSKCMEMSVDTGTEA